jgi:hypothetical protein
MEDTSTENSDLNTSEIPMMLKNDIDIVLVS